VSGFSCGKEAGGCCVSTPSHEWALDEAHRRLVERWKRTGEKITLDDAVAETEAIEGQLHGGSFVARRDFLAERLQAYFPEIGRKKALIAAARLLNDGALLEGGGV
jgi:hypothetical protein